jgi:hypothetical protein
MLLEHAVNSVRENPNKGQKLCSAGVADWRKLKNVN